MRTVLVVDDEPQLLRALQVNLEAEGYRVLTALDGMAALKHAEGSHPDAMVLDLGLPDINGVDVITRIRRTSSMPIIVLSARHGSVDKVRALDAGADDYVTKPFGLDELLAGCGWPAAGPGRRRWRTMAQRWTWAISRWIWQGGR